MSASVHALVCHRYGPLADLEFRPLALGPPARGELRVRVEAVGINFPDALLVTGRYQERPVLPFVPGGELSGTVIGFGPDTAGFAPGDRVMAVTLRGALASEVNVRSDLVRRVPDGMPMTMAAALQGVYCTAHYALSRRAQLRPGETLLVTGASGGVGLAALQLGVARGARVIAAASTREKLAFAMQHSGVTRGIAYGEEPLRERLRELEADGAVDVVLDPVGGAVFEPAARAMRWDGRYVVVGFASGTVPCLPANLPLLKGFTLTAAYYGRFRELDPAGAAQVSAEVEEAWRLGQVRPVIERVFPFHEAREALQHVFEGHARGKVVVQVAGPGVPG